MNTDLLSYASALCARKEYCRSEIAAKLRSKGAAPDETEQLLQHLEREGFIDEARYARAFVADKFRFDHWGRVKMRYQLLRKGVSDCDIDAALEEIDEKQYRQALADFVKSRRQTTAEEDPFRTSQKIARAAISRGYEPNLVFNALNF